MKEKTHLIYGIIIGILLFACTGSLKENKAEFEVEEVIWVGSQGANERMAEFRKRDGRSLILKSFAKEAIIDFGYTSANSLTSPSSLSA